MCTVDSVQCSVGVLKEPDRPGQICASQWGINSKIREEKRKDPDFFVFLLSVTFGAERKKDTK